MKDHGSSLQTRRGIKSASSASVLTQVVEIANKTSYVEFKPLSPTNKQRSVTTTLMVLCTIPHEVTQCIYERSMLILVMCSGRVQYMRSKCGQQAVTKALGAWVSSYTLNAALARNAGWPRQGGYWPFGIDPGPAGLMEQDNTITAEIGILQLGRLCCSA